MNFFYKESKSNTIFFLFFGEVGGGEGRWMDGQTNRSKLICPFNFFEVGGITMHKCTSYVPDRLNL